MLKKNMAVKFWFVYSTCAGHDMFVVPYMCNIMWMYFLVYNSVSIPCMLIFSHSTQEHNHCVTLIDQGITYIIPRGGVSCSQNSPSLGYISQIHILRYAQM